MSQMGDASDPLMSVDAEDFEDAIDRKALTSFAGDANKGSLN